MEKGRRLLGWTGVIALSTVLLVFGAAVYGIERTDDTERVQSADIIVIDAMSRLGRLDRPPVIYRHDKHTEALQKQGKDCAACHLKDDKQRLSQKFMRLQDLDREATMRVYHDNCIACHTETLATGEKGGPVTCGECHAKSPQAVSSWQPIGMDKSLHYRHAKSQEQGQKCGQCHHEYDEKVQKLVYVEGKESSCRYCHKDQTEEKRVSFREASHQACITCHQETLAKKKEAGPVQCAGCHDAEKQMEIASLENVPRMKRNQPDVVFVKTGAKSGLTPEGSLRAKAVPFNHRAHETYNDTCRACHHASLTSCAECHTVNGTKEGDFVRLEQAMHQLRTDASCLGCHTQAQAEKS